jgi:hypothetical protein
MNSFTQAYLDKLTVPQRIIRMIRLRTEGVHV